MAKMIIRFEEFGGIAEFNGLSMDVSEALIINKAVDNLVANMWAEINDEEYVNYKLSWVNFGAREAVLHIEIKGV